MGDGFDVEIGQMDLAKQLFSRQQGHMTAIDGYISRTCTAPGAFRGVMSLMQGHYSDTLGTAHNGMGSGRDIADHCATKIGQTKDNYLRRDRRAYERFAAKEKAAGRTVAPYKPPAGGGPLGPAQRAFDGSKVEKFTPGPGAAADYAKGTAAEIGKKGLTTALDRNDPKNRAGNPTRYDQWRAGRYNRRLYGTGNGLDPAGGYRDGDYYSSNRRTQSAFDRGYYKGSRYAASHVPDGTAYSGAADQDGNITQNRRPGSAWGDKNTVDNVTSPVRGYNAVHGVIDGAHGVYDAATGLHDAIETNHEVDQLAHSQSNTGSRDWADNDKGGTW